LDYHNKLGNRKILPSTFFQFSAMFKHFDKGLTYMRKLILGIRNLIDNWGLEGQKLRI